MLEAEIMDTEMSKSYNKYVESLETQLEYLYNLSQKARGKGLDPSLHTECHRAKDLAALVEGLVGPRGVAEKIRELSDKLPREELALKVSEKIVNGEFGHMPPERAAEQAIRTTLAIFTEGLTAAPLQGVAKVKIKNNRDGTRYLSVYFAGPIRSAGGTDQALTLVIGDFVRRLIGLDKYTPTKKEVARFIEEVRLYERSVARFQYHVSDEELRISLQYLPVEVTGTASNDVEISSYRNLQRIETNCVRGGALRVVNDGIVGRSSKVLTIVEKLGIPGWEWLNDIHQTSGKKKSAGFMEDVIAGRPVFSFPSNSSGFRLRYGRSRNSGLAAVGVHPASMHVVKDFLATGTQIRMELPGKGGVVVPVDALEPPVVKLKDGSVLQVSVENFGEIKGKIKKILFLGDILINFGDFLYNSKPLATPGYVEEWWVSDLNKAITYMFDGDLGEVSDIAGIPVGKLNLFLKNCFSNKPNIIEAINLSKILNIPLHPSFTYFWSKLSSVRELVLLKNWLVNSEMQRKNRFVTEIVGNMNSEVKTALEKICLPHKVINGKIHVGCDEATAFAFSLNYEDVNVDFSSADSVLEALEMLCGIPIKPKTGTSVGARMGRPEKAKMREMTPRVHVLFPVGLAGGSRRNVLKATEREEIYVEVVNRKCPVCNTSTFKIKCPKCGSDTILEKVCPKCKRTLKGHFCPECKISARSYALQSVNIAKALESACNHLELPVPKLLKGVKGLANKLKIPEILEKGVLRAKYDLSVYKDGTIRFDTTNAPLTHFKPSEIGVSAFKLNQLGYSHDTDGEPLETPNQMCELKIQDIVVPRSCAEYFVRVANFIDDLLTKVYGLQSYYNVKKFDDLIGILVIGLAPHTSVGILGRIIGFTDMNVCYAHPIWHSAKRRDCDGDEDALMLGLDTLLNFSRKYLPAKIGGIMDAPLLLIPAVDPVEVQRQAHDLDVDSTYPLKFYEEASKNAESREVSNLIDLVEYRLGKVSQFEGFGYTIPVSNINSGNYDSSYKRFESMTDKLKCQLELADKIEAVDAKKVALKVLTTHFIRDIAGNLRAFTTQNFRCKSCNKRFRRLPLRGKCPNCDGELTLTVYRGGIEKYLNAAQRLIERYDLPEYYNQRIMQVKDEIHSLFEGGKPKQISLVNFV